MPEASPSKESSGKENEAERQDTFDRAGDNTKCEDIGMVFLPCLDVEREDRWRYVRLVNYIGRLGTTHRRKE